MSHITLVRHGQANSAANNEAEYDRLSDLGHEQAAWLGSHLRETDTHHTRLYSGTLRRHVETAAGMATGLDCTQDARLNELEYFTLATLLEQQHGIPFPKEQAAFTQHLPVVFEHWKADKLEGPPESWASFHDRIHDVLHEIAQGDGPALVVTSGGLISMAVAQSMDLSIPAMARVALAIMNTSMHRFHPIGGHLSPVMFNAVPHLDTPTRRHAQTHI